MKKCSCGTRIPLDNLVYNFCHYCGIPVRKACPKCDEMEPKEFPQAHICMKKARKMRAEKYREYEGEFGKLWGWRQIIAFLLPWILIVVFHDPLSRICFGVYLLLFLGYMMNERRNRDNIIAARYEKDYPTEAELLEQNEE